MNTAVTILQVIIGTLVTIGGLSKLILSYAKYSGIVPWSKEFKPEHLRLLGVLEVLGGVGLLLPLVLPSLAVIATLAAVGVALYMAGAVATHLRRSEYPHMIGIMLFFIVPSLFVAYGTLVGFAV